MSLEIIVLAAGQGTRMRSALPKVLHTLAGRPLLTHVLETARRLKPRHLHIVIGAGAQEVQDYYRDWSDLDWVEQDKQLGTGHAVGEALPRVADEATVLALYGDVPLIAVDTLNACVEASAGGIALVTTDMADPSGFGRIVRETDGRIVAIVEDRDVDDAQRAIREINTGILAAPAKLLRELIDALSADNAQGEYYLTDVIAAAEARGLKVAGLKAGCPEEVAGVNDRAQLAELERYYHRIQAARLMREGVTLRDPARIDVRGTLQAGVDTIIDVNVVFEGRVVLGRNVSIGPNSYIRDAVLDDGVIVESNTVIDGAKIARGAVIGPFARIRPGTELGEAVRIGNFVETKKAKLGAGTKASHLAYLGDAQLGEDCNVGAGTITCNYDGVHKHRTDIGDGVFIGTNSTLVAPLTIDDQAYIGAGSTITEKVESEDLAIGRARQRNVKGWTPPAKRET
ncbi:MAG: bifunctional UDP-N-acetylglucosamine diphosphorylase/glucosamine-1-phosphate N-acetyltransferase GlmU [Gammaproteobacteria bacterium]|nr:bifunctional UDP-N-acetylglucosamine diphosphorylase/glucosamine-1-phosphate N-acetyltransferase GlmU [Gammaproteobacteria bacterium]